LLEKELVPPYIPPDEKLLSREEIVIRRNQGHLMVKVLEVIFLSVTNKLTHPFIEYERRYITNWKYASKYGLGPGILNN